MLAPAGSELWTVVRIASGFFFLFMAFNTVGGLVSTLVSDNQLVQASSSLLYIVFTLSTIVAPFVIGKLGARLCMFLGAIPYVLLVFANTHPSWALFMPAYFGVGLGAALLWISQGIEMSRAAVTESKNTGQSVETINSRFNGMFWSFFQFNGAVGLIIASTIFVLAPNYKSTVTPLFIGFGVVGCVGVLILSPFWPFCKGSRSAGAVNSDSSTLGLLEGGRSKADSPSAAAASSSSSGEGEVSVVETVRFAWNSRAMQLLIPIIFYNGASLGFFQTMYPLSYEDKLDSDGNTLIQRLLHPKFVGYVTASFYIVNSLCSYLYGSVIVPRFGRKILFVVTFITQTVFLAMVIAFVRVAGGPQSLGVAHGSGGAYALVFFLAILFAIGDSVLESQLPALVQSPAFLPSEKDRACAVSNLRLWQSLGFAVQFGIGIATPGNVFLQALVLVPMLILSLTSLFVLDACVRPIQEDSRTAKGGIYEQLPTTTAAVSSAVASAALDAAFDDSASASAVEVGSSLQRRVS